MGLRFLELKKGYNSSEDDILTDFYIPVLEQSVSYDRITGYFSSRSLSIAAKGIAGLIMNNGHMRVITSPELSASDYEIILGNREESLATLENSLINSIYELEDFIEQDHLSALCWMLSQGKLDIRVAIPNQTDALSHSGIFHMKVGVFKDVDGDIVSFSGSINETAAAWSSNKEEFKVFSLADPNQAEYCRLDMERFEKIWNNQVADIKVVDLPTAVKNELLKKATHDIDVVVKRISCSDKKSHEADQNPYEKLSLFDNQQKAVEAWVGNSYKGVFAMATGTGKTRTAIGCIVRCIESTPIKLVIVSAPQNTILRQWINEIERIGLKDFNYLVADSTNPGWQKDFTSQTLYSGFLQDFVFFVFTTHRTLSSDQFISALKNSKLGKKALLVCDEVHGIGARKSRNALIEDYPYRLGLSATPTRWFDDDGSKIIFKYFGHIVYSFTISQALQTPNPRTNRPYLTKYYYYPVFVSLTDEEIEEYKRLTQRVVKLMQSKKEEQDDLLQLVIFARANVYKKASNKLIALESMTTDVSLKNTIIFTCDSHISRVQEILYSRGIVFHKFTENEGTSSRKELGNISEREDIIRKFTLGYYDVLVSIKCLDEGVDIPTAEQAIIMTSSSNPREYIQRIGRVLRQHPAKNEANIYDMVVIPNTSGWDDETRSIERKITVNEIRRAIDIANNASNRIDAVLELYKKMEEL